MPGLSLRERMSEGLFLLDGAMGTQLIARGTGPGHIEAVAKKMAR
jgi:methionine synthase I (cobalamin-dependent)